MREPRFRTCLSLGGLALLACAGLLGEAQTAQEAPIDLRNATVVVRQGGIPPGETIAPTVLIEEVERRTGIRWGVSTHWPESGPVIAIASHAPGGRFPIALPEASRRAGPARSPEGYLIRTEDRTADARTVIWIIGADGRGTLFGVGDLLRNLHWGPREVFLPKPIHSNTAPALPLRGHQLGYRYHSNTYDAWDDARFEQYIRELTFFGVNAIEGIPFQDERESPHYPLPRRDMNRRLSEICAKYDIQYWLWAPAGDLSDEELYVETIARHEELYGDCPRIDAIFFPGGDPGNNPPQLVMPFLEELSGRLRRHHPDAAIWMSLQGFSREDAEYVLSYLEERRPDWMGGLVAGPGSPPIAQTRERLDPVYGLRHYPDITHTVRSQYPTIWWDVAFGVTLGREPINPEPVRYSVIQQAFAPYTVGTISYSDGVNDDANKVVWSRREWDPKQDVRDILAEYARVFFGPVAAEEAADGILALERNWRGPLAENAGVDATYALWDRLARNSPHLADNWRWLMYQLRANYDVYTRHRLFYEQALERKAYEILLEGAETDPDGAMDAAWAVLKRGETERIRRNQHDRIVEIADRLFELIGMQTSVERHRASGTERGCVIDLIHYPLFNRWWLEDEFEKIRGLDDRRQKIHRLITIATWEEPGEGSFYDDVGNVGRMPRRIEGESVRTDPLLERNPNAGLMFWDGGYSRTRPSWQSYATRTLGLRYGGLDPDAGYTLRATGYREPSVKASGVALEPREPGPYGIGEFIFFDIDPNLYRDGSLVVTWEPPDESHLNWREHSRLTEVWLLRD
jgi:hypothetical protein